MSSDGPAPGSQFPSYGEKIEAHKVNGTWVLVSRRLDGSLWGLRVSSEPASDEAA